MKESRVNACNVSTLNKRMGVAPAGIHPLTPAVLLPCSTHGPNEDTL